MSHNYYKILKVKKTASLKQIKSSYRLLAKKYHPDLNPNNKKSHELFIELEKAYSTLSDPILRKSYDKTLKPLKRNAYKNYKDKYKHKNNYTDNNRKNKNQENRYTYNYDTTEERRYSSSNLNKNGPSPFGKTIIFGLILFIIYIVTSVFDLSFIINIFTVLWIRNNLFELISIFFIYLFIYITIV